MKTYDIAIAGGAMAGGTLALALDHLANGALSIAVIEPYQTDKGDHPGFDSRAIALSYGTKLILDSFGLWSKFEPLVTPINTIHVSDRGHAGLTDMYNQDYNVAALGYVVELVDIGALYSSLFSQAQNINFYCPDSVESIERSASYSSVSLTSGEEIQCKLLVAADGANSLCNRVLGHQNISHDFEQVAVIANVDVSEQHMGRAFERFTASGPLALLPMSENRMSVVWCLSVDEAEEVMQLPHDAFLDGLQEAFGWRLGKIIKAGARASYPLILQQKEQVVSHRFATVGNAAQLLHPIAGQGFNLGIRDVKGLVDSVLEQEDVGVYSVLNGYMAGREKDRTETVNLTAGLVHIFSNDWFSLQLGRNMALMAMDNIPFLKAPLLTKTMGLVKK